MKLPRAPIITHARRIFHVRLGVNFGLICLLTSIVAATSPSTRSNAQTPPQKSSQIFRGAWSAETSAHSPNSARGSWTLTNDANETILEGTWSAQKTTGDWQGTWTARTRNGRSLSGTWNADLPDLGPKSLQNMFERTLSKQVAGSWRSGHDQGYWWLNSTPSK
jgi:hypothetical protein